MMTGIPELDAQYSGLTMEGKVILQSLGTHQYRLAVSISHFRFLSIFFIEELNTYYLLHRNNLLKTIKILTCNIYLDERC